MCVGRFNSDIVSCCPAMCHFQFVIKMPYWPSVHPLALVSDTDNARIKSHFVLSEFAGH